MLHLSGCRPIMDRGEEFVVILPDRFTDLSSAETRLSELEAVSSPTEEVPKAILYGDMASSSRLGDFFMLLRKQWQFLNIESQRNKPQNTNSLAGFFLYRGRPDWFWCSPYIICFYNTILSTTVETWERRAGKCYHNLQRVMACCFLGHIMST